METRSDSVPQRIVRFSGTAYELETGKLLYKDMHEEFWENGKHARSIVQYINPEGNIFATKRISFLKNRSLPDFNLEDFRDGYLEGGEFESGTRVRLFARRKTGDPIKEKVVDGGDLSALDGGFDYFVEDHWSELLAGKRINFRIFVPVELDTFRFYVEKTKTGSFKGRSALFLRMRIENSILSVFIKPIDLIYDIESKRIMEYKGTSNINNEKGKSYNVRIVYDFR
ncbi:hypothetical protein LEP1GSC050_3247 [Leptospira broomii serovar Hurstbridge str. 5399]|uniref:Uncharacterized protein n=1 Tax=Leptospira broomii serovar Hurstbridge str. 5399 TaxID=1049789 RepID=T0GGM4_9LEPT|nr:hypothetical protein LEP1GSC050_3247 [Leptospira broomii serovar Hurstbridge str. 5399]